jgi:ParB-like chromosome segregation protein Spo0J
MWRMTAHYSVYSFGGPATDPASSDGMVEVAQRMMADDGADSGWPLAALVSVAALRPADSPRLAGENAVHARTLAVSDLALPPIVVHRATMRVVDGMHRLRAAMLRGDQQIGVRFFDGPGEDAFVLAVRLNVQRQGLPLSLPDRRAAAARILCSHGRWSDRAIASITGLSHKTVGVIRRQSTGEASQSHNRIGRDGRVRPVDGGERRRQAGELMVRRPDASLREIAKAVGISPGTVRDVRDRLRRGDNRAAPVSRGTHGPVTGSHGGEPPGPGVDAVLHALVRDPSLRFSAPGRMLLHLLEASIVSPQRWAWVIGGIPSHCAGNVADAARRCAQIWLDVAGQVEGRIPPSSNRGAAGDVVEPRSADPRDPAVR